MKKALTIVIGFIHDFAAGCWAATVIAVYYPHKEEDAHPETHNPFLRLRSRNLPAVCDGF